MGDVRFVSETDAVKMLNISRTNIWRLRRAKEFVPLRRGPPCFDFLIEDAV